MGSRRGHTPVAGPRPKVVVIGPGFNFMSGISIYTCRLCQALTPAFDVRAMLIHNLLPRRLYPGRDRVGDIEPSLTYGEIPLHQGLHWYWGTSIFEARRFLIDARPDLLVMQWWTAATLHTYLAVAAIAKRNNIPYALEFHELQDPGEQRKKLLARYSSRGLPLLIKGAAGAVAHSRHDAALLEREVGLQHLSVVVARHGPYDHLSPPEDPHDGVGGPEHASETVLLFFGLIRPYKGLEDLVRVFNSFAPGDAAKYRLLVVGETWEKWDLPGELIERSPYRDRITFVNRYVTDEEAAGYFKQADALVLPYRRGSSSGPLHIAMSAGLPVVAYAVAPLTEELEGYEGALLATPDDLEGLRGAIDKVRPLRGQRFGDPHSWEATADAYRSLHDQIRLQGRSARRLIGGVVEPHGAGVGVGLEEDIGVGGADRNGAVDRQLGPVGGP